MFAIGFNLIISTPILAQEEFHSKKELNDYIFQNSNLEDVTNGYFLNYFGEDLTPNRIDSMFLFFDTTEVAAGVTLSAFQLLEKSDVTSQLEIDSVLFPEFKKQYANNGQNKMELPLFLFDCDFSYLNEQTFNQFLNWGNTSPFPAVDSNQLATKNIQMAGLIFDTVTNNDLHLYWDEETFFSNTNKDIEKVEIIIGGDSYNLSKGSSFSLDGLYNNRRPLQNFEVKAVFTDSSEMTKTVNCFLRKTNEITNEIVEEYYFEETQKSNLPWDLQGGFGTKAQIGSNPSLEFSILWGCGTGRINRLTKPFIIVSGWGPYTDNDFIDNNQNWPSSIEDVYFSYNRDGLIDHLSGAGYDVIIAKFYPPNESVLKNAERLETLIKLINEEKESNGSYEENIITGYSAGAMCVRLALQKMEKNHLENNAEHHHSKLFVSFDGEHGGANVPLGLQHMVEHLDDYGAVSLFNNPLTNIINVFNAYALHYILNAPLSRELLAYFYTETGTSSALNLGQGPHPDREYYLQHHDWFDHAKNNHNPGYPSFTRNISISNGTSQSNISGSTSDHYPFPEDEGHIIFKQTNWQRKWEASFIAPSAGNPWVFRYDEKSWGHWDIVEEARVHNPLILDNAPGGTTFLAKQGSDDGDPNTMYNVLNVMENALVGSPDKKPAYDQLYAFTPTILTHDIRNFEPSATNGRLDYDMKEQGLMYNNINNASTEDPEFASSYFGYPHLAHPQDHYTTYTPFDAVFAWDNANTVHIGSGEAVWNPDGNDPVFGDAKGRWEEVDSPIGPIIKDFIVDETDYFDAYIQNRRYGWNARSDYEYNADIIARNDIYAGQEVTQKTNFNPVIVEENANVKFQACNQIVLKPGFKVEKGATFEASITDKDCGCGGVSWKSGAKNKSNNPSNSQNNDYAISKKENNLVNSLVVKLYPNPGKDVVNLVVEDEGAHGFEYKVYSVSGILVDENSVEKNTTRLHLKQGMYIVKLKYKGEWHTKKLIMQ